MINFIMQWLRKYYLKKSGLERISPNDWVDYRQIVYDKNTKLLTIKLEPNVKIFRLADTDSMDGLMDIGHNVIATDHFDKDKLAVGDIVIYQVYLTKIVHRIVEIGWDTKGTKYYRCRGDNNVNVDKWYLGDKNIKFLVIGIFY